MELNAALATNLWRMPADKLENVLDRRCSHYVIIHSAGLKALKKKIFIFISY